MLKEFKNFIMTGNVIEFAIAVILAGAVGLVVNSFVGDVVMPVVGHFAAGMDFKDIVIELAPAVGVEGAEGYKAASAIKIGSWINTVINLIIVGFVLFMMSKAYNKSKKKQEAAAPAGPSDNDLLTEIRDALKK